MAALTLTPEAQIIRRTKAMVRTEVMVRTGLAVCFIHTSSALPSCMHMKNGSY